jgi:[acyl-carrier-protein] S-malonyltransferase
MDRQGLLFPGQGRLEVGMGRDLAGAFASARRTFDEASEELGIPLDEICFDGPAGNCRAPTSPSPQS